MVFSSTAFSNDTWFSLAPDLDVKEISIYDTDGKLITTKKVTGKVVDVSYLSPGNYILKIISKDQKSYSKKIIKY